LVDPTPTFSNHSRARFAPSIQHGASDRCCGGRRPERYIVPLYPTPFPPPPDGHGRIREDDRSGRTSAIVSTEDTPGGEPCIEGRPIGVLHVAPRVLEVGETPEAGAADYELDLADVHRALTYYHDHLDEMRE